MGKITPQILLTFVGIDKNIGKTIGNQLYAQLKNGIYEGMLRPGDRMPSSREMCAGLKISRNTVALVFEQLTMEGFLKRKPGRGHLSVKI
jgi:GntR family transcriptional regulator / MocR family aminotransferase